MTIAPVRFPALPLQLSVTAATLYTMPATAGQTLNGARLRFANTDTAVHFVTAFAGAGQCVPATPIAPGDYLDADMPVLGPSGSYSGFADAASVVTVTQLGGVIVS